jgi:hypothetical protein
VLPGEQPAILDRDLFDAVQARLNEQVHSHKAIRTRSEALLAGRIFDDRGNRMSPSHSRKGGYKYRYYLSSALLQGAAARAGSVRRVPAAEVEAVVMRSVREHLRLSEPVDDPSLIKQHVARVEVQPDRAGPHGPDGQRAGGDAVLPVPRRKTMSTRRREIILPEGTLPHYARPMRSETRSTLVAAIARGRRWLDELIADATATADSIAQRENCSVRKVNMTISLAFLAPDLVKATIDGRLPHGMGVTRLAALPAEWSQQHHMLGLPLQ